MEEISHTQNNQDPLAQNKNLAINKTLRKNCKHPRETQDSRNNE